MDLKYTLEKIDIKSNLETNENLYKKTVLGKDFTYFYITDALSYSITHTIFYMTDMGKSVLLKDRERVLSILKNLIHFYAVKNNADILAELLLCLKFISGGENIGEQELLGEIIKILFVNQQEEGYVLAPNTKPTKNKSKQFFENYHTTLVALGGSYVYKRRFISASDKIYSNI